jgi:spore coat polysaccharide biosynthesis protein SpsF (cytidylyltransferase family)
MRNLVWRNLDGQIICLAETEATEAWSTKMAMNLSESEKSSDRSAPTNRSVQTMGAGVGPKDRQTIALIDLAIRTEKSSSKNSSENKLTSDCRLDGALRKLDGLTLLEWCVRRLSESTLIDSIVVTGPPQFRDRISNTGLCNARWVPSTYETPSQRAMEIATRFSAEWVVFASPLCPFTDPTLLDRLVTRGWANPDVDFVGFLSPSRPNFSLQSLGLVGEMCSRKGLEKLEANKLWEEPCDIPDIVRRNPGVFVTKLIPLPEQLTSRDFRFQLETVADRDRAATYLEIAGDDLSWQKLAQVADRFA